MLDCVASYGFMVLHDLPLVLITIVFYMSLWGGITVSRMDE